MNIRQKIMLGAALLTLVPVAITAFVMRQSATTIADEALERRTEASLTALRDSKRAQISDEIESTVKELQYLAVQKNTVEAMRAFKAGFATAAKDSAVSPEVVTSGMSSYIQKEFGAEFAKRNTGGAPDITQATAAMDPAGAALQSEFIFTNPNKLGEKDKLVRPAGSYPYAQAHATYHPDFESAQNEFEFYDIFLIDTETDNIVYTVFKELDFGTSLKTGIAANSKLAEAYNKVKNAAEPNESYLSDFAPYLVSYNDLAAFAAVPIFDGDKQIGVMAIQYPINLITESMSANKQWKKIGLGDTGDMFLVGPDKLARTNVRYLVENKDNFVKTLGDKLSPEQRNAMLKKDSSVGLLKIDSDATRGALAGQEGFAKFIDYRGVSCYGAFAPLTVQGLNWGIVAKIDEDEADIDLVGLQRDTLLRAIITGFAVTVIAGLLVAFFVRRFLAPIAKLADTVQKVASGDTAARSELKEQDEIGELGRSFDGLLDDRIASLEKAGKENETLNNSVITLLQTVFQLSNRDLTARAPVTEDIIGTVSSSINQLSVETGNTLAEVQDIAEQVRKTSESVRVQSVMVEETARAERESLQSMSVNLTQATQQLTQMAALSDQSNTVAGQAAMATQAALTAVDGTVKGMDQLRESISDMEKRFKRLGERSQEISTAVQLINTISERTHVLALNASMQAATAGEAGRGFAVVAEEVQRLSDSSRQATAQISQLVGNIQAETNETLFTVNRLIGEVVKQSELAQRAGVQMTQTQSTTAQLVSLVRQIAAFSDQQAKLSASLQQSVLDINQGTEQTSTAIAEQSASTQTLADFSRRLTQAVGQFKLPGQAV
jgi:methyl-accepting chemotaxis protein